MARRTADRAGPRGLRRRPRPAAAVGAAGRRDGDLQRREAPPAAGRDHARRAGRSRRSARPAARRAARRDPTLYPETENRFWPLNDQQGVGDVGAVSSLLDHKLENGCYDERRLAIAGVSDGAGLAVRLGCAQADRFAAVVAVAAGLRALAPCPPQARASFLEIHGSADTVTPYRGAPPDRRGSVPRFAAAWARRAGCGARPRTTHPAGGVTRTAYRACAGGRHVETILLAGTDHGWPGAGPPLPRHNPSGFHASPAVIDFIRRAPPSR